jgi:hypothetical protein
VCVIHAASQGGFITRKPRSGGGGDHRKLQWVDHASGMNTGLFAICAIFRVPCHIEPVVP